MLYDSIYPVFCLLFCFPAICSGTTIEVSSTANSGAGSLRAAVTASMPGDTIEFSKTIDGQPILLQSEILLDQPICILGNGPSLTIIDGQQNTRIMRITASEEVLMKELTLRNGRRADGAGAISNIGNVRMNRCHIRNNTGFSEFSATFGGGILNSGTMVMEDCRVIDNVACSDMDFSHGGGVCNFGSATFINCYIAGNHALAKASDKFAGGGGVYSHQALSVFINCAITGNLVEGNSAQGGGLFVGGNNTDVKVLNTTCSGNQAKSNTTASGGGIYRGGLGDFTMTNSIVGGNIDGGFGPDIIIFGALIIDGGYNLISDSSGVSNRFPNSVLKGSTINPIDPGFAEEVNTATLPNLTGDMQLTATSPALQSGTPDTTGLELPDFDLAGRHRLNGIIDIGAHEYCPEIWTITSTDINGASTFRAENSIEVGVGVDFSTAGEFLLDAPTVSFTSENALSIGTILTIEQQGCQ